MCAVNVDGRARLLTRCAQGGALFHNATRQHVLDVAPGCDSRLSVELVTIQFPRTPSSFLEIFTHTHLQQRIATERTQRLHLVLQSWPFASTSPSASTLLSSAIGMPERADPSMHERMDVIHAALTMLLRVHHCVPAYCASIGASLHAQI